MEIGGVIIEVTDLLGKTALMHHGGYKVGHKITYVPIVVSWSSDDLVTTFDLRGWTCRIMQVIWPEYRFDILATPVSTSDGMFTIDWSVPKPLEYITTKVFRAEDF